MEQKKQNPLVQYILERVNKKNKNFVMVFCGPTGSGKSYSALRLAELLDPSFNIERCCFKAKDFLKLIKKLEIERAPSGTVVLWDELGSQHSVREFMSLSNRVINYIFQTCRYLNLIILMTVPLFSFVDSATQKLCHATAEVTSLNYKKKKAKLKIKMIQTNVMTGKIYPKHLRYKKDGKNCYLSRLSVNLPSKELTEVYEEKKREYTSWLYQDGLFKMEKKELKERRQNSPGLTSGSMQEDVWLIATTTKWITQEDIRRELSKKYGRDVDQGQFSKNVVSMRKRGYDITDYKAK
jgi:energy-coupling factor transporter ATP-binding protein EcfA2